MEERFIDRLLDQELSLGKTKLSFVDLCFVAAVFILALAARLPLYPLESTDWNNSLSLWLDKIREVGALKSIGMTISNYTSPYMYIMSIVSGFGNGLYALKTCSVIFDFIASIVVFKIVLHLMGNQRKAILAMAAILFCPTVVFNSAWWCQCDSIYVTFLLAAIYCILKDKSLLCCIFLGIAFSFKVQTLLLLPFVLMMWLENRSIKFWHLSFIPMVYLAMHIPALLAGRPFFDTIVTYYVQAGYYSFGTLKFPNMYVWMDEVEGHVHHIEEIAGFGLAFSLMLLGGLAYYVHTKKIRIDSVMAVTLAIFSFSVALFTLPHMHDRYSFLVDLLVIIYAFQRPQKAFVAIGYITISAITYLTYLIGVEVVPWYLLSFALLGLDVYLGCDLYAQIKAAGRPASSN